MLYKGISICIFRNYTATKTKTQVKIKFYWSPFFEYGHRGTEIYWAQLIEISTDAINNKSYKIMQFTWRWNTGLIQLKLL